MTTSDDLHGTGITPVVEMKAINREAVGIFDDHGAVQAAIDSLLSSGFARCQLSLPDRQSGPQASESAETLADDPDAARTENYPVEVLGEAQGSLIGGFAIVPALGSAWIAGAAGAGVPATTGLAVATGGTGVLLGLALAAFVARRRRSGLEERAEQGGLLLWVRVRTDAQEQAALAILRSHAGHYVHSPSELALPRFV